jgi:hypothetical protein
VRRNGGGRKSIININPEVVSKVKEIVDGNTFGNPENPLSYTSKSLRRIEAELNAAGYKIGYDTVNKILQKQGYSLQLNRKMMQIGSQHIDRNKQFEYINEKAKEFIKCGEPVISVDAKKKELVGNFKNSGRVYREKSNPIKVLDHDFPLKELGKVTPYGIYDVDKNAGFVNLGISADTSEFAVESILRWWQTVGRNTYPNAIKIYINCDGGGSNGSRVRLWKYQLQEFANITGLEVHISHFPPGTSKWNKIEHKLFCYISSNWKGIPLISIETIIALISNTSTQTGLEVKCIRDDTKYELGIKVSDEDFDKISIIHDVVCPSWNYVISPSR